MTASWLLQRLRDLRRRRSAARRPDRAARWRSAKVETLEKRCLLASLPYGADPQDGSEVMLGDVLVTVVLMESDGTGDTSTEDWTPPGWTPADGPTERMQAVKELVREGIEWWEETLARQGTAQAVDFLFDFQYADVPVPTSAEPIARTYDAYEDWVPDFLRHVNPANTEPDIFADMRDFNHAQRTAHGTDWAFTVFVVDSENDVDNEFEPGGIRGAFAFAGGPFLVLPSRQSASVVAHETGHVFYALDEYDVDQGGDPYTARRGYYNTQNRNADDDQNPLPRVNSIMDDGQPLSAAYADHLVSPSAMEMIGWRDSDFDGVYDILDVAHSLQGTGVYDPVGGVYRFVGASSVQTLPNRNPYPHSLGNAITLNRIHRAEYRVDEGPWQEAATYDAFEVTLDLSIPRVPASAESIEIRTVDAETGVASVVFSGNLGPATWTGPPGVHGFAWLDLDQDNQREAGEAGLAGWTVNLNQVDGPAAANTSTNQLGAFNFAELADGTYEITIEAPASWSGGVASPASHTITVAGGAASDGGDFAVSPGGAAYWQNAADPLDVNADGGFTQDDLVTTFEMLRLYGIRQQPLPMVPPYVDVDGDGMLSLLDARILMGQLIASGDDANTPARAAYGSTTPAADSVVGNDDLQPDRSVPEERRPAYAALAEGRGGADAAVFVEVTNSVSEAPGTTSPSASFLVMPEVPTIVRPLRTPLRPVTDGLSSDRVDLIDDALSEWSADDLILDRVLGT